MRHKGGNIDIVTLLIKSEIAEWVCSKTHLLPQTCRIQNLLLVECDACSVFGRFVPVSWMCKKQTAVSRSSTEAVILSLDAGLRMEGLLDLSFSSTPSRLPAGRATFSKDILQSKKFINGCVTLPYSERTVHSVDHVPRNVGPSNKRVHVLVFEVSQAAIKMIIQGKAQTCATC